MRIKFLHKRRQQHRQQPHQQQSDRAKIGVDDTPLSTPTSPSLPSQPVSSKDGRSLERRSSTFGSLERQISGVSLRTTFGRMRRSRSPPPPYTLEAPADAAPVNVRVAVDKTHEEKTTSSAAVVGPRISFLETSVEIDAITVVEETSTAGQDTKAVAAVDVKAVADAAEVEEAAEQLLLDVAAAPLEDLPPPSPGAVASYCRLGQPVVIPRLYGGATVPFARGYAPCLGDTHGIDAVTFLAFIDGLNLVTSPHPAALALSAVAFSMNFVPHDYANAIGAITQLLADVGTKIVAYKRAQAFLARANTTLFEPRGLHASIVTTKRLRAVLGIEPKAPLLAPLSEETLELATLERCMYHLNAQGWAASVELEARTGCLMPIAKPSYRKDPPPDPMAFSADSSPSNDQTPPPLRRSSSTWTQMGRSMSYGLAVVADKRVRFEIKKAEKQASGARKRAWKRHNRGKKLKEPFGEKYRVGQLSWILIRNLDDVQRENAEKEAEKAAKKASKKSKKSVKPEGTATSTVHMDGEKVPVVDDVKVQAVDKQNQDLSEAVKA
ncbi:hypothetical protein SEUCBS139899_010312 [Sporothrix eucalyptigena]|uniref:Uncharacterized protein n=1 Tax=Sporothrix eucalyptigena TaxID=1812306 RepID=A0ABP0D201_9PEZI